jgi:hypothetical protein
VQLADAGVSGASDDPVAQAAARAAIAARQFREAAGSGDNLSSLGGERQTFKPDDTPHLILASAESEDEKDPRFGIGGNGPPPEDDSSEAATISRRHNSPIPRQFS